MESPDCLEVCGKRFAALCLQGGNELFSCAICDFLDLFCFHDDEGTKRDLAVPALRKNSSKKNWMLIRSLILGEGNTEPKPYQFWIRSQYGNKRTEDFLWRQTRKARHGGRK